MTAIFGSAEDKSADSEKLLNLYWNRAELKKEFAGMRKEQFRLQDRIKQQEGATARLQQKLDHLENLLIDPEWVHNVVVFYQLRNLALRCEKKLAKFAEQLKQQREQKQHNHVLDQWNDERAQETHIIGQQILLKRDMAQQLQDQLQAERTRLTNMSGFVKIFRRRSVMASLDKLAAQIDSVAQEERDDDVLLREIENRNPPDNAGLDIASKRLINLMIIAFAQQLYIQFEDDDLAVVVQESREKSVGAINYGARHECGKLLNRIEKRLEKMEQSADFAAVLQQRVKLLGRTVQFRDDSDAVPISLSVATLYRIDGHGVVQDSEVNLLGENYWSISKVLGR